jgi:hypothetical protein
MLTQTSTLRVKVDNVDLSHNQRPSYDLSVTNKLRIISAACALIWSACSGTGTAPKQAAPDGSNGGSGQGVLGGMDGAGQYSFGLQWDTGIFVQPQWRAGRLEYLVINQNDTPVNLFVEARGSIASDTGEPVRHVPPVPLVGSWSVPARSHRTLEGSELRLGEGYWYTQWWTHELRTPDAALGTLLLPPPLSQPTTALLASNYGLNGSGGDYYGQIETEFEAAPGSSFSVTYVVPPGDLSFLVPTQPEAMAQLQVTAVHSDRGTVRSTEEGFAVEVPWANGNPPFGGQPIEYVPEDFARVSVEVTVPPDAAGPAVMVDGWFCYGLENWLPGGPDGSDFGKKCADGYGMLRAIPLSE